MTGNLIQGSADWLQARCGSLGASQVHEAIARTKTGWGASRANLMATLICERLTGCPQPTFVNDAMRWGTEQEPFARQAYAERFGVEVFECGLVRHPEIVGTHASPDGLVGEAGMVELKCPNTATHLDTLRTERFAEKYVIQASWQLACTGREWVDLVSYDPRLPPSMRLFVQRVPRDLSRILDLEHEVSAFLAELDATVAELRAKCEPQAEAA